MGATRRENIATTVGLVAEKETPRNISVATWRASSFASSARPAIVRTLVWNGVPQVYFGGHWHFQRRT